MNQPHAENLMQSIIKKPARLKHSRPERKTCALWRRSDA